MPKKGKRTTGSVERAAALRREIERLKGAAAPNASEPEKAEDTNQKRPMSARDFINKRMAELDKQDD